MFIFYEESDKKFVFSDFFFPVIKLISQELNLAEAIVNRLQTVGLRFCGAADQALPRLRGALPYGIFLVVRLSCTIMN